MCAYELKEFLEGLDDYALVLGHPDLSKKVYEEAEPPGKEGKPREEPRRRRRDQRRSNHTPEPGNPDHRRLLAPQR